MVILYGTSTRNGKGALCESVLKVLGSYRCTARLETLAQKINTTVHSLQKKLHDLQGCDLSISRNPAKD